MSGWYARPVLFVASVEQALAFYVDKLGFTESSRYAEDGVVLVAQVERDGCDVLLNSQQPEKTGQARMFVSLDGDGLAAVRAEFERRGAPAQEAWWGYDALLVKDPDGNEWWFPYASKQE